MRRGRWKAAMKNMQIISELRGFMNCDSTVDGVPSHLSLSRCVFFTVQYVMESTWSSLLAVKTFNCNCIIFNYFTLHQLQIEMDGGEDTAKLEFMDPNGYKWNHMVKATAVKFNPGGKFHATASKFLFLPKTRAAVHRYKREWCEMYLVFLLRLRSIFARSFPYFHRKIYLLFYYYLHY